MAVAMNHSQLSMTNLNRKLHTVLDGARALKERIHALDLSAVQTAGLMGGVNTAAGSSGSNFSNEFKTAYDSLDTHCEKNSCCARNGTLHIQGTAISKASNGCEIEQAKLSQIRKWASELPLHDLLADCLVARPFIQSTDRIAQDDPLESLANLDEHRIAAIAATFESRLQRLITARLAELRTSRSLLPRDATAVLTLPDPPHAPATTAAAAKAADTQPPEAGPVARTPAAIGAKRAAHIAMFNIVLDEVRADLEAAAEAAEAAERTVGAAAEGATCARRQRDLPGFVAATVRRCRDVMDRCARAGPAAPRLAA